MSSTFEAPDTLFSPKNYHKKQTLNEKNKNNNTAQKCIIFKYSVKIVNN
jgi:hypothetical protein